MLVFKEEGKTGVPGERPLGARERTNNKLNPHKVSTPGHKECFQCIEEYLISHHATQKNYNEIVKLNLI